MTDRGGQPPLDEAETRRRLAVLAAHGGNKMRAAQELGISRSTMQAVVASAERRGITAEPPPVTLPSFPDDDVPVEEIIGTMERRFHQRNVAHQAKQWFPIKVNIEGPVGVLWFGDPHLDDDGCHWPLLRRHIAVAKQPGVFGANIGDTTNNWTGRLARLFGNQETSQATARKLAKWFLTEAGVTWLLWLMGNHDAWGDGGEILRLMGAAMPPLEKPPMEDWQARFRLVFPNGREARIHAAHNFPGHSMWNTLHGPQRAAHTKAEAHLYVAGHTHNWALHQEESASREFTYWLARARGYKFLDDYGEQLGHQPQQEGAAILSVFDPDATTMTGFLTCFADPEEGAEFLAWKRQRTLTSRESQRATTSTLCGGRAARRSRKAG